MTKTTKSIDAPLVTVITPAYNRASFLEETILSVLNQDYRSIEYIVLDDGSTDDSLDVIKKYEHDLRWVTHENMGEQKTVNKGFAMANGEVVVVVNSDDPLLPGAVSAAVAFLQEHRNVLAAYPDWGEIGPDSEIIRHVRLPQYDIYNMLTTFSVKMGPGTFIRRKVFALIGMRDTQFRYASDVDFWFRLALHGKLGHIPKVLATHRVHPAAASISGQGRAMAEELIRVAELCYEHPLLPSELRKLRPKVLSIAHYSARHYCGSDYTAALTHLFESIRSHPLTFFSLLFSDPFGKLVHRLRRFPRCYEFARRLHRRTSKDH